MTTERPSLVGLVVLALGFTVTSSASFSKEFVSPSADDNTRSMKPKPVPEPKSGFQGMDMGKALCDNYSSWSDWSSCGRKCEQTRVRTCTKPKVCGETWAKEKRTCMRKKGPCFPFSYKVIGDQKRNRMIEELLYDLLYELWTPWGPCTSSCKQKRTRTCKHRPICVDSYIQEERRCIRQGFKCKLRISIKLRQAKNTTNVHKTNNNDSNNNNNNNNNSYILSKATTVFNSTEIVASVNESSERLKADASSGLLSVVAGERSDNKGRKKPLLRKDMKIRPASKQKRRRKRKQRRGRRGRGRKGRRKRRPFPDSNELRLAQKNCGMRPEKKFLGSFRVLGGQEVVKNSWPWQVAILTRYNEQYCGGTLIAPRWVLTAAHCVRKKGKKRKLVVRVGEHDIENYDYGEEDIRPEKDFPHPDFDYHTITNDIALIKLSRPPPTYTASGYACLPDGNFSPRRDQLCSIVGWGKVKSSHLYGSSALHQAEVPVVKHKRCQRVFKYTITADQVCAGYKRGGIDSCAGDSGGPLLCKDRSDRYTIYGVTSYGEGCGLRGKYGIYSKVSSYLPWIIQTINGNS